MLGTKFSCEIAGRNSRKRAAHPVRTESVDTGTFERANENRRAPRTATYPLQADERCEVADMRGEIVTGTTLAGRYRLEERIASGGMGSVWRARDEILGRAVAVKLLREDLAGDPAAARRFRREALTAASVSHPHMANVFDYVEEDRHPGIVMELVEGETLAARLEREAQLPPEEAVRIAMAMLDALDAAHRAGIIHRDVKPGNVMLERGGAVKVADFGIARVAGDATLTQTGLIFGSPHYLAPEQLRGETPTPAADVYAAGVVLYEMLTGRRPFEGDSPIAIATARLAADPPPPRAHRPDLRPALDAAVMRALAREPDARFSSAREMRAALETALGRPSDGPAPESTQVLTLADAPTEALQRPDERPARTARPTRTPRPPRTGRPRTGRFSAPTVGLIAFVVAATIAALLAALAAGPRLVSVPRFQDRSIESVRTLAERVGIELVERKAESSRPAGTVLGQSVAAGTEVRIGTKVRVRVSTGPPPCCRVPALDGLDRRAAEDALSAARLVLGKISRRADAAVSEGTVVDQDPAAGVFLDPGDEVDVVLADKPQDERRGKGRGRSDDD